MRSPTRIAAHHLLPLQTQINQNLLPLLLPLQKFARPVAGATTNGNPVGNVLRLPGLNQILPQRGFIGMRKFRFLKSD